MYIFSPWQQKAIDADTKIQKLKQEMLQLERDKRGYLFQHFRTIGVLRLRRKKRGSIQ